MCRPEAYLNDTGAAVVRGSAIAWRLEEDVHKSVSVWQAGKLTWSRRLDMLMSTGRGLQDLESHENRHAQKWTMLGPQASGFSF